MVGDTDFPIDPVAETRCNSQFACVRESGAIHLPWTSTPNGGVVVSNVTFVNFKSHVLMGCAYCGRGDTPMIGDGGFETRFEKLKFVNSSQRALFRHSSEG